MVLVKRRRARDTGDRIDIISILISPHRIGAHAEDTETYAMPLLDPAILEVLKWPGWPLNALSAVITYELGKRAKIDDLRIKKQHELREQLSIALQQDYQLRESLTRQYKDNFGHLDRRAANEAFAKHEGLYQRMRECINDTSETRAKIHSLAQEGSIYLKPKVSELLSKYLEATTFSYTTDGMGGLLINTYYNSFFEKLLDDQSARTRIIPFHEIMNKLRKFKF